MTRYERIKSMTLDEMAGPDILSCSCCVYFGPSECFGCDCKEGHKQYLEQEADDEAE